MSWKALGYLLGACVLWLIAVPAFATDTVYYFMTDALHSTVVVTDQNRNIVEETHYGPYGLVLNRQLRDGPGYAGHEEDPATGLVYMQQRYYDPQAGRFISTDPVPVSGGAINRYAYASDNPYRYTDPTGEMKAGELATPCRPGPYCGGGAADQGLLTVSGNVVDVDNRSGLGGGMGAAGLAMGRAGGQSESSGSGGSTTENSDARQKQDASASNSVKKKQRIEYYKGVAREIQIVALHGKIPTDWVETAKDIGDISAGILLDNMAGGESSFEMYAKTGMSPNPLTGYVRYPINWSNVDWVLFTSQDRTYIEALHDFSNYAKSQQEH